MSLSVLSEMESSALMSMTVVTIHSTQMQSAITPVAATNLSVTCTDFDECSDNNSCD